MGYVIIHKGYVFGYVVMGYVCDDLIRGYVVCDCLIMGFVCVLCVTIP